jgi:hypothetical protein
VRACWTEEPGRNGVAGVAATMAVWRPRACFCSACAVFLSVPFTWARPSSLPRLRVTSTRGSPARLRPCKPHSSPAPEVAAALATDEGWPGSMELAVLWTGTMTPEVLEIGMASLEG